MKENHLIYKRVLVFAAHYDDEITMAGTIAKMAAAGTEVQIVNITDGSEGYPQAGRRNNLVARRKREAAACDRVLGISRRWHLDIPDMGGSAYTKDQLQECVRIIRQARPEAIFTHGPRDMHNDHRLTSGMTVDAAWHAGQPVAAVLGKPWPSALVFFYKGVGPGTGPLPEVNLDVTAYAHKRWEALATQNSQFTLFKKDRKSLLMEAEKIKNSGQTVREKFWLAPGNQFTEFPQVQQP
jgi:LmbE family N-acetylglucosaminyl deacetylase